MKFELGTLLITRGPNEMAKKSISFSHFISKSLRRHANGDWGDLCNEDKQANKDALKYGERLFSKYDYNGDVSIYIITEWDRSATTILFPEEY